MNVKFTEKTHVKRPASLPVSLEEGRLDVRHAVAVGAFALGSGGVGVFGIWVLVHGLATGRWFLAGLGVLLAASSLSMLAVVLWVALSTWWSYKRRVDDWHYLAMELYQADGLETVEHVSEWSLTVDNPAHVLLTAFYVYLLWREGNQTPWSTRALYGPMFLANRRVGELSKQSAEQMGRKLAQLGLIEGRSERNAGEWVARSADDVLQLVVENW